MPQATATHFSVSAPANSTAGQAVSVTITALDAGNNTVGSYAGSATMTSTDGLATLSNPVVFSGGSATTSVTFKTASGQTVTATDSVNSINGTSGNVNVVAAPATHFHVSAPGSVTNNSQFSFAVTALDPYNNTDTNYAGMVHFTSTDGSATLPADSQLPNGIGIGTFPVTLITTGPQTLTATDTVTATITVTSGTNTVN
jgi:hypothetical protein